MVSLKIYLIMCIQLEKYCDQFGDFDLFQFLKISASNVLIPSKRMVVESTLSLPIALLLHAKLNCLPFLNIKFLTKIVIAYKTFLKK